MEASSSLVTIPMGSTTVATTSSREPATWRLIHNSNNNSRQATANNTLDILNSNSSSGIQMVRAMTRATGANSNSTWAGITAWVSGMANNSPATGPTTCLQGPRPQHPAC